MDVGQLVLLLVVMPQEGIVGIRIVIQPRTGANWTRKGAETDGGYRVLELTGRRLGGLFRYCGTI